MDGCYPLPWTSRVSPFQHWQYSAQYSCRQARQRLGYLGSLGSLQHWHLHPPYPVPMIIESSCLQSTGSRLNMDGTDFKISPDVDCQRECLRVCGGLGAGCQSEPLSTKRGLGKVLQESPDMGTTLESDDSVARYGTWTVHYCCWSWRTQSSKIYGGTWNGLLLPIAASLGGYATRWAKIVGWVIGLNLFVNTWAFWTMGSSSSANARRRTSNSPFSTKHLGKQIPPVPN